MVMSWQTLQEFYPVQLFQFCCLTDGDMQTGPTSPKVVNFGLKALYQQ